MATTNQYWFIREKENLWATYIKDSVSCETEPNHTRTVIVNVSKMVTNSDHNSIEEYIDKAIDYGLTDTLKLAYASDIYSIITTDTTIAVIDRMGTWNEFNKLVIHLKNNQIR